MEVNVRRGEAKDVEAVFQLIKQLAIHEKAVSEVANSPEQMLADGFGEKPAFHLFVAEHEQKIVGISLYFFSYSTWKGKSLYLDDLVIAEEMRGNGIGKLLIDRLVEEAEANDCTKVHWQVSSKNDPAIRFYTRLGAKIDKRWMNCNIQLPRE